MHSTELRIALAHLRQGTEILRTGGGVQLTARDCNALLAHIEKLSLLAKAAGAQKVS